MKEQTALRLFFAGLIVTTLAMAFGLSALGANSRQMAFATVALVCVSATAGSSLVGRYHR